jgi:hypothetical protein
MNFRIANQEIQINEAYTAYNELRLNFTELAMKAERKFSNWYENITDCAKFSEIGFDYGKSLIIKATKNGVDYLIQNGMYDMTTELFLNEYLIPYISWATTFEEWDSLYNEIIREHENREEYRRQRAEHRSRIIGGGFGISGAAKGILTAAVANVGLGIAHKTFNGAANLGSGITREKKLRNLLKDEGAIEYLKNSILRDVFNIHFAVFDALIQNGLQDAPEFVVNDQIKAKSERLTKNLIDGKIPKEKIIDLVPSILEGNPYDKETYLVLLIGIGDKDNELERYGEFHGIDIKTMKLNRILSKVNPLLQQSPPNYLEAKNQLLKFSGDLGQEKSPEIKQLTETIDIQSRTFQEDLYETMEAAYKASVESDLLKNEIDEICENVQTGRQRLIQLKAQSYTYHKAQLALAKLEECLIKLDTEQRTFDGDLYETKEAAEKAAIECASLNQETKNVGESVEEAVQRLTNLKAKSYLYKKASSLLQELDRGIIELDTTQRTFDEYLYASKIEAEKAHDEKEIIHARLSETIHNDLNGTITARQWISDNIKYYSKKELYLAYADECIKRLEFSNAYLNGYTSIKEQSLFIFPNINEQKITSFVKKSIQLDLSVSKEEILVYFDETVFGDGSKGIGLTLSGLIITVDNIGFVEYKDIVEIKAINGINVKLEISKADKTKILVTLTQGNKGAISVAEIISQIVAARNPVQKPSAPNVITDPTPDVLTLQKEAKPALIFQRRIGFFLGAGIIFMPYIFSFFTLRKGHSTRSRIFAFVYLIALVGFPIYTSNEAAKKVQPAKHVPAAINDAQVLKTVSMLEVSKEVD